LVGFPDLKPFAHRDCSTHGGDLRVAAYHGYQVRFGPPWRIGHDLADKAIEA
jgi:hypothetical protein